MHNITERHSGQKILGANASFVDEKKRKYTAVEFFTRETRLAN